MNLRIFTAAGCLIAAAGFLFSPCEAAAQAVIAYSPAAVIAPAPTASLQPVVTLVPERRGFFRRRLYYRPVLGYVPVAAPTVVASPVVHAATPCCGGIAPVAAGATVTPNVVASPVIASPVTVAAPLAAPRRPVLLNANGLNVLQPPPTSYYAVPY